MEWLVAWGWLCGHRRHIQGPGDILAARRLDAPDDINNADPLGACELILVEVKSTVHPYDHFTGADRKAMREVALEIGAEPWLAWWPARGPLAWVHGARWPERKGRAQLQILPEGEADG